MSYLFLCLCGARPKTKFPSKPKPRSKLDFSSQVKPSRIISCRGSVYEMDGQPSVTEMERGGVYEMEIANLLCPFLWHLVCPSISYGPKLFKIKFRIEIWTFLLQICFRNKFSTLGSGQIENYANMRICVFSVWPLPEVKKLFRKQIWNENVHISILNFFLKIFGPYEMDGQTKCHRNG